MSRFGVVSSGCIVGGLKSGLRGLKCCLGGLKCRLGGLKCRLGGLKWKFEICGVI